MAENPEPGGFAVIEQGVEGTIGSATACARVVSVLGVPTRAVEIGDTYTHPAHRRQGIFSRCVRESVDRGLRSGLVQLVYGCPNDQSLPGYVTKLNFASCPAQVEYLARFVTSADLKYQLETKAKLRSAVFARLASVALWAIIGASARQLAEDAPKARHITRFPPTIDGDWGAGWDNLVFVGRRTSTYLNWRFFKHPEAASYRVYAFPGTDGKLDGYYVAKLSRRGGVRECALVDLMSRAPREVAIARALLDDLESRLSRWHVDVVKAYLSKGSPYSALLRARGFRRLRHVPVIVSRDTDIGRELADTPGAWHFMMSDCDHR